MSVSVRDVITGEEHCWAFEKEITERLFEVARCVAEWIAMVFDVVDQ
jgi:hypothetical protein